MKKIIFNNDSITILEVDDIETFQQLYKDEALFIQKVDYTYGSKVLMTIKMLYQLEQVDIFYFTGSIINEIYHLTGDNCYPDNCPMFIIHPDSVAPSIENKIVQIKNNQPDYFARYFSDVLDNDIRREIWKNNPYYNNHQWHSIYGDEWFYKTVEEMRPE